jgi:hypothetical protein
MPDEPLTKTLKELRRSFMTPRRSIRLPDTEQTRRDLAHGLHHYELRQCSRCSRSFFTHHSGGVLYCSRECQQADRNERRAERRKRERQHHPRKPIKCAHCGKRVPPERSTRRYCSDACRQAAYRKRIVS